MTTRKRVWKETLLITKCFKLFRTVTIFERRQESWKQFLQLFSSYEWRSLYTTNEVGWLNRLAGTEWSQNCTPWGTLAGDIDLSMARLSLRWASSVLRVTSCKQMHCCTVWRVVFGTSNEDKGAKLILIHHWSNWCSDQKWTPVHGT